MTFFASLLVIGVLAAAGNCASCTSNSIDGQKLKYCGELPYDKELSMCCNGGVSPRPRCSTDNGCCGTVAYDKTGFQCCQGVVGFRQGPLEHNKCCGTVSFDNSTHMCCSGAVNPRPDGDKNDHKCCRGEAFNNVYGQCKDGVVVIRISKVQ